MGAMKASAATQTSVAPARACAHRVLLRVFDQGAYADRAMRSEGEGLPARDRALATRLSYGAVQRAGTLDHLIEGLAGRPPAKLDPPVRASLRLGLYELLYLEGAPDYAVVADAVELAKRSGRSGHGLVNAVLRRAAREGAGPLLGGLSEEDPKSAAIKHSHPEWIATLWWQELGAEHARALLARDNEPSELALRVNTLRVADPAEVASTLAVPTRGVPGIPEALIVEGPFDLHASPQHEAGLVTAQSRAAMLVAHALSPQPGESVLDLCAAPGGKTTHLAALMEGRGRVVAVEAHAGRARALARSVERMGADGVVEVVRGDAREPRSGEQYDRVLVDPPCSGLGTLQARPDLRWRIEPGSPAILRKDQFRILDCGAQALRPQGLLVYSTCTISPTENEHLIADFLDSHPEFQLDDLAAEHPGLGTVRREGEDQRIAAVREKTVMTLPHRDDTAGFFIARLSRR